MSFDERWSFIYALTFTLTAHKRLAMHTHERFKGEDHGGPVAKSDLEEPLYLIRYQRPLVTQADVMAKWVIFPGQR